MGILRLLRLFKSFRQLSLLASGLIASFSVVIWIVVLFGVQVFVISIFCTMMIGHSAEDWETAQARKEIEEYFGTVLRSMLTAFQFVTLDNWTYICNLVAEQQPLFKFAAVIYILFTSFTIVSLLTGVVCDHITNQVAKSKENTKVQQEEEEKDEKEFNEAMDKIHSRLDEHGLADKITRDDFVKNFCEDVITEDDVTVAQANIKDCLRFDISIQPDTDHCDIREVFDILDVDEDGFLSSTDFKEGFSRLRGDARAKNVYTMLTDVNRTHASLSLQAPRRGFMDSMSERMDNLAAEMQELSGKTSEVSDGFSKFLEDMGQLTPRDAPATLNKSQSSVSHSATNVTRALSAPMNVAR